jgi:hypothetical protein
VNIGLVLLDKVGSGCGALSIQHPTTANNHIQQNQNNTPNAVTSFCSTEDGHNDARNMLR